MLSFQNPHHLSGPVAGPMILPKGLTTPPSRSRQSNAYPGFDKDSREDFKPSTSKDENAGSDAMVQAGKTNGDQRSRSHSSDSISGSGSEDNRKQQRRSRKRRMQDEEQEQERQEEEEDEDEEEEEAESSFASRNLFRLAEKEDGEEEEDEEEAEEEEHGEAEDVGRSEAQGKILTQKPLGLLAHHGLSSAARSTSGSIRFHRNNNNNNRDPDDYDDDVIGEEADDQPEIGCGGGSVAAAGIQQRGVVSPPYLLSLTESDVISGGRRCHGDYGSTAMSLMDRRFMPSPPLSPSASPGSEQCPSTPGGGHHWTFEEQFKQLYELTDDPNRKLFLDDLFSFMQKRGTPVNRIPIMAKQTLDLFELFQLVVSKGGLVEVINKKLWREITKGLSLPSSITSAAFTLRTQYMKYLYPYECEKLKLSTLSELQYAVDGNRREGRRSGFGQEFSPLAPILPLTPAAVAHMHEGLHRVNQVSRPQVSLPMKDRDHVMLTPTFNQLRTLAECEAQSAKAAANQAMAEVTKRMEEATRAALNPGPVPPLTIQGHASRLPGPAGGPSSTVGGSSNQGPKTGAEVPAKRPGLEDDRRFHSSLLYHRAGGAGVSTAHIRLTSQENGHSNHLGNSIIGSMEINGVLYQGVLFAQSPTANVIE